VRQLKGQSIQASKTTSKPVAAMDIGSNTVHVTVARRGVTDADLEILADESDLVRLGHDVGAMGALGDERTERAIDALRQYTLLAGMLGCETILCVATGGVRAASNGAEFLARARRETGLDIHIISGEQEGMLSYWGASSDGPPLKGDRAVVDLGGSSLEIAAGHGTRLRWRVSLPLGAGALRDRIGFSDPPTLAELNHAYQAAHEMLAPYAAPQPLEEVAVCGGTARAIANVGVRIFGDETDRITVRDGRLIEVTGPQILTRFHLESALATLTKQPAWKIAQRFSMKPARARILAAGVISLLCAMESTGVSRMRVSGRGIREGAILAWLHAGRDWLNAARRGAGW
jgi:exopolyphosphatase/guanosine-5'-triphosphate,3'-diphosphate pyrophosphatase